MRASVVVVLKNRSPDAAARFRSPTGRPASALSKILKDYDAGVLPGATSDSGVVLDVPNMESARRLAEALCALDEVETAYPKPGEELP
ncbi:MAG TPA: hypothetical protein VFK86_13125 [Bauldia sp.]|nr:hypothetical protein [Bauldia sp.]